MSNLYFFMLFISTTGIILFDFNGESQLNDWYVVNDGVMGGLSQGHIAINKSGNAVFYGNVSLDNYGGFTSIRYGFEQKEITGKTKAIIRLKGDGKRYQFRLKRNRIERHSYIHYFETSGEWETIEIPLVEMYPTFRGRKLDMPNFTAEYISDITFLIANNKAETFKLEIDKILLE